MMVLGTLLLSLILVTRTCLAAECACSTLNVHIRQGPGTSHAQLGMLIPPHCLTYTGQQVTAEGYTWAKVEYQKNHHVGSTTSGCPHIVSRQEWGARAPHGSAGRLSHTPKYIFVHHSATHGCHTQSSCAQEVRSFQNYHMDSKHYSDIEYSFLIGEDGNVYEGRGWDMVGAHTLGHNHDGLGFCVIGTFTHQLPNDAAMSALKRLIGCAVTMGKVTSTYTLKGHRDVRPTECPGQKLYDVIRTWPHYG
ncbi:peptidoglycan-recognition protein SC2-like [Liolophura sinensis]|uniref:peptidoglycan-recognition protein SC2-like n=1 Tax=Liolophura sinensis TaxID=3198878 RepID=UPI00315936B5